MPVTKPTRLRTYNVSANTPDQTYVLYSCPANCTAYMSLLFFANGDGTTSVSVTWYRTRYSDSFVIVGGKNMTSGEYVQFSDGIIVLEPGDEIRVVVTGAAAPNMDFMCTVEEEFKPVG